MSTPCEETDADLWFSTQPADIALAREQCGPCPILTDCLVGAIERVEPWGVWGGEQIVSGVIVSAPQVTCRRPGCEEIVVQPRTGKRKVFCSRACQYIANREPKPINHGTDGGYRAHRRRGEDACHSCAQAASLAKQLRDERSRQRAAAARRRAAA